VTGPAPRRLICRDMSPANEEAFRGLARSLRRQGRSEQTIAAYHAACKSIQDWLAFSGASSSELLRVAPDDVTDWLIEIQRNGGWTMRGGALAQLGRPLAKDSVVSYFSSLRTFCNWAVLAGLIDESPMRGMAAPPKSGKPVPLPDIALVRAMLATTAAVKGKKRPMWDVRDEWIIRLFCETGGPRCSEVALLPVDGLDLRRDEVTIHGKGGRWRKIALSASTAEAGQRWMRARAAHKAAQKVPYVLLGAKGPLSASGVYQVVRRRAELAGGRVHPHQLRHLAADLAKTDEMGDGDMMTLFGWTTTRMLHRYGAARAEQRALESSRRHAIGDRL
jgi:site-specific recombinase XerD